MALLLASVLQKRKQVQSLSALPQVTQPEEAELGFQPRRSEGGQTPLLFTVNVALLQCISAQKVLKQPPTTVSKEALWGVCLCPLLHLSIRPFSPFSPIRSPPPQVLNSLHVPGTVHYTTRA